jgi:Na+/proline symporter
MAVIFAGMFIAFYLILQYLPDGITFTKALEIAGASDKMKVLDFSWDLSNRYTVWTGILGGTFLMLSYFGTDQSQVQRYLSGKSVRESQLGLIFNGLLKVPMQFFILLVGVMVFVFYQFNTSPLNFNPKANDAIVNSEYALEYKNLEQQHIQIENKKKTLIFEGLTDENKKQLQELNEQDKSIKKQAKAVITKADAQVETNDKDYVFIHFILHNLPKGLIGLLLAVILSAAMSSTASELNALASTTVIDLYKRNVGKEYDDAHYVKMTKLFTLGWGILAISVACVANLFDNLIQLVNIIGSIFYGNVLGIFLLAFFFKFVKSNAVFIAAIITQLIIIYVWKADWLPFLWLNALGAGLVILIASLLQYFFNKKQA